MGKGFGRGAKAVAIVTHAESKGKGKKTPRGLRGASRRIHKRQAFAAAHDEQEQLEQSMGVGAKKPGGAQKAEKEIAVKAKKTLAQKIANISMAHSVAKKKKGFKQLRKELLKGVKEVRRRHSQKGKEVNAKKEKQRAAKYVMERETRAKRALSGNTRRNLEDKTSD